MVMAGDSCSEVRGFESQRRILEGHCLGYFEKCLIKIKSAAELF